MSLNPSTETCCPGGVPWKQTKAASKPLIEQDVASHVMRVWVAPSTSEARPFGSRNTVPVNTEVAGAASRGAAARGANLPTAVFFGTTTLLAALTLGALTGLANLPT